MTKTEAELFAQTIAKYSLAIGGCLYPSQVELLKDALKWYRDNNEIPEIEDAFTRLAFLMIVSDLIYQENEKGGKKK